jgi:hypothetical protein
MSPGSPFIDRHRALLALVLGTVILGACSAGAPITATPQATPTGATPNPGDPTTRTSPSTAPEPTAERVALGDWEELLEAGELGDVLVTDMIATDDGYVAVGCEYSAVAEYRQCAAPAAWTVAVDGAWSRADVPAATGGEMSEIVRTDRGFIAGGQVVPGDPMTETRAAFWTSADGRTWDRLADADDFKNASVTDLFAWRGGFIASGFGAYSEAAGVELWGSENGRDWTPIQADFGEVLQTGGAPYSGGLILWGQSGGGICAGPCRQTVWLSQDSETWTRVPDLPSFDGARFSSIVESGGDLLAVGSVGSVQGPERAAIWVSRDGLAWAQAPLELPLGGESHVWRYIETEAGPLAVGTYRSAEQPRLVSWKSPPGPGWEWTLEPIDQALPQVDTIAALAAGPDGLIAVLHPRQDLLERAPAVWRRPYVEP